MSSGHRGGPPKPTPKAKEQTLSKGTNWCAKNGECVCAVGLWDI